MPKPKTKLSVKLNSYLSEFGNILSVKANSLLFCNVCNKEIKKPFKKYSIKQHFATQKHIEKSNSFNSNDCKQLLFNHEFNDENIFITSDESVDEMNEEIDGKVIDELNLENNSIRNDLKSTEKHLIEVLESIKDKVKQLLNECNCVSNYLLKDETKQLLQKYEQMREELHLNNNKSIDTKQVENKYKNYNKSERNVLRKRNSVKTSVNKIKKTNAIKSNKLKVKTVVNKKKKNKLRSDKKSEYVCVWPGCDMKFDIQSKLNYHFRVHTGEKKYVCTHPNCGRAYNRLSVYEYHMEIHKSGHKKTYQCEWEGCDKMFAFRFHMFRHLRVNHLKVVKFKCEWDGCGLGFPNRDQYDVHVGQCHLGKNLYECLWPKCGKRYKTRTHLQRHQHYSHLNTKRYKCDFENCNESFIKKEHLIKHKNVSHNLEKPLTCDWPGCEFSTVHAKSLKNHKMRHTGERPYKCLWPQCEWSFRKNCHLKTHMLKHTGERPVACNDVNCEQRFQSRHAMKIHFDKTHKTSDSNG